MTTLTTAPAELLPGTPTFLDDLTSDAVLLVEVSDTTPRYDRGTKANFYAADGIPDYWLVNLRRRTLEVRRQPENVTCLSLEVYHEGDSVSPIAAPHASVRVADLLPITRKNDKTN